MPSRRSKYVAAVGAVLFVAVAAFALAYVFAYPLGADTGGDGDAPLLTPQPTPASPSPRTEPMTEPVTVAFIADSGMTNHTREVLGLIERENADIVVHSGDFDYEEDPQGWSQMLDEELGSDYPYVATIGNHDVYNWSDYSRVISQRVDRADGLRCTGDIGLRSTCAYGGVTIVQSSIGICDMPEDGREYPAACKNHDDDDQQAYVANQLAQTDATWRICSWHKVHHEYQVGDKDTQVPYSMYDTCRENGGIVATGHDHAYARTYPMSDFSTQTVASRSPPYTVGDGTTFAVVSAASGYSFYEPTDNVDAEWWASTHTEGEFGAFFCTLRPDGTGECYYKTVDGEVIDGPFEIRSGYAPSGNGSGSQSSIRSPDAPSLAAESRPVTIPPT